MTPDENPHRRHRESGIVIQKWLMIIIVGSLASMAIGGGGTGVRALILLGRIEERLIAQEKSDAAQDRRLDRHDEQFLGVKHDFERVWDKMGSIRAATPKETAHINGKSSAAAN